MTFALGGGSNVTLARARRVNVTLEPGGKSVVTLARARRVNVTFALGGRANVTLARSAPPMYLSLDAGPNAWSQCACNAATSTS